MDVTLSFDLKNIYLQRIDKGIDIPEPELNNPLIKYIFS